MDETKIVSCYNYITQSYMLLFSNLVNDIKKICSGKYVLFKNKLDCSFF